MSRDDLIHTLREALETLTQRARSDDQDIDVPDLDDELIALAQVRPPRTVSFPLYW